MDTKNEVYMITINFCQLAKVGKPVGHPAFVRSLLCNFLGAFWSENPFEVLLYYFEFLLIIKLGKQN